MLTEHQDHQAEHILNASYKPALVHQIVKSYIAIGHTGTKKHKGRAEVSGGNSKPWPQKGKGLARAGSIRSPLFRKGGKTFPALGLLTSRPKVNKKMYQACLQSIMSELFRNKTLKVTQHIDCTSHKTKDVLTTLFGSLATLTSSHLLVSLAPGINLIRGASNVPNLKIIDVNYINPVILLKYKNVWLTDSALSHLAKLWQRP